jgi:basic membrane lipoprotein Med (substrate-binding protein (PBP1-ABC) superfamily)
VYKDFDACLLTGTGGIRAGSPAAPVWKGMQDASAETLVRVSYLEVIGEQTKQNALPFLNSLVQRQCDVVLAVGAAQVDAAEAEAKHHPEVRFVVVGGEAVAANVTAAGPGDHLSSAVAEVVTGAYQGSL